MSDLAACITGNSRAARAFEGPRGAPSHLDRLLAKLGDSHYPASRELGMGGRQREACVLAGMGWEVQGASGATSLEAVWGCERHIEG